MASVLQHLLLSTCISATTSSVWIYEMATENNTRIWGVCLVRCDARVLFVLRGRSGSVLGYWCSWLAASFLSPAARGDPYRGHMFFTRLARQDLGYCVYGSDILPLCNALLTLRLSFYRPNTSYTLSHACLSTHLLSRLS